MSHTPDHHDPDWEVDPETCEHPLIYQQLSVSSRTATCTLCGRRYTVPLVPK